ncbi:hypothetical protein LDENG_00104970 [Lucifuga dentata]|nr:hypothetical protein LDENG_00104970 [Lucifuga dentata]
MHRHTHKHSLSAGHRHYKTGPQNTGKVNGSQCFNFTFSKHTHIARFDPLKDILTILHI